jgi:hypothetical protein
MKITITDIRAILLDTATHGNPNSFRITGWMIKYHVFIDAEFDHTIDGVIQLANLPPSDELVDLIKSFYQNDQVAKYKQLSKS